MQHDDGPQCGGRRSPKYRPHSVVAGVPAVIGTLWDSEDREAAPVMRVLHEEMAHSVAPAVALREAQLASIHAADPPVRDPLSGVLVHGTEIRKPRSRQIGINSLARDDLSGLGVRFHFRGYDARQFLWIERLPQ